MKGIKLVVSGNWAHFRKPETSNNPLSHDFITKTALIGLMGAVLGVERKEMRQLFPQLSEDLKYGVEIRNAVKKQSWGFTYRSNINDVFYKAPKQMEIIRNPSYTVLIGLENNRSEGVFVDFRNSLQNQEAYFTPVLGIHNCPADLEFLEEGEFEYLSTGAFETTGFITTQHQLKVPPGKPFRLGFEKIPTYQNDDFWNLPDKYVPVVYPSEQHLILANGPHYIYNQQSQWVLI